MPFRRWILPLLAALASGAESVPSAKEVFEGALERQGAADLRLEDVHLRFEGIAKEEGEHVILREYWYRASDRSFRVRTKPEAAAKQQTDRGVLGEAGYWERSSSGKRIDLSPANRDDREVTRTIERDRGDFEDALRLVLLSRLRGEKTQFLDAAPGPVRLERDRPHESRAILGEKRDALYRVIDVVRPEAPRLRLFIREEDRTVRKAVLFDRESPDRAAYVYYFGPFEVEKRSGLLVPLFLSGHTEEPLDEESSERGSRVWGTLQLRVNAALPETIFRGAESP